MGKRTTGRRLAMQVLYQTEVGKMPVAEVLERIFEEEKLLAETKKFARELATGTTANLLVIDDLIRKFSRQWRFEHLSEVDKSILRLAIYELKFAQENPPSVVINEALELAKKFSTPEAAKFINGILSAVLKEPL